MQLVAAEKGRRICPGYQGGSTIAACAASDGGRLRYEVNLVHVPRLADHLDHGCAALHKGMGKLRMQVAASHEGGWCPDVGYQRTAPAVRPLPLQAVLLLTAR